MVSMPISHIAGSMHVLMGGLKTGLRKYPDDESDPFGCKPSWYLYRDLATERETESCEFAKKIIGIEDWDEIIHMLKAKKN